MPEISKRIMACARCRPSQFIACRININTTP
jgi:hypothetical protein